MSGHLGGLLLDLPRLQALLQPAIYYNLLISLLLIN
jgi:hypothetical protein